jgi:molybdate transport system substrate-binding protein
MRISVLIPTSVLAVCKVNGAEVNVYAAASLTDVMKEIPSAYENESGDKILFNFGASSLLARQIIERAPADMFLSADEAKMDELEQAGLIATETRHDLLSNLLVIVVPSDSKLVIASPEELVSKSQKIAVADPRAVPAGIYTKEYLTRLGLWQKLGPKIVPTENVRAALAAVESGNFPLLVRSARVRMSNVLNAQTASVKRTICYSSCRDRACTTFGAAITAP